MSSVVRANLAGRNLLCIGSLSNIIRNTMFAAPQIKTDADLKGGIFGISSAGSESDSPTSLVLRRLGLTREDVTVKEIGVDRLTPLRRGAIAATLLGEPQRSQAFGARAARGRRSLRRAHSVALQRSHRRPRLPADQPRHARALPEGHDRGQSSGDRGRERAPRMCWPASSSSPMPKSSTRATPTSKPKRRSTPRSTVPAPKTFSARRARQRQPEPRRLHRHQPDRRPARGGLYRRDGEEIREEMPAMLVTDEPRHLHRRHPEVAAQRPSKGAPVLERKAPTWQRRASSPFEARPSVEHLRVTAASFMVFKSGRCVSRGRRRQSQCISRYCSNFRFAALTTST